MIWACGSETFDDVQCVAMEVACPVEPCLIVEACGIDDECLSLPVSVRPAHPAVCGSLFVIIHVDRANSAGVLVQDHDVFLALKDLKRLRHVSGPRNTREVAFDFWIESKTVFKVLFLLRQRVGKIRKVAAFHYSQSWRRAVGCAKRGYP